jgi:sulfate/thiosulfate transport system permease protein
VIAHVVVPVYGEAAPRLEEMRRPAVHGSRRPRGPEAVAVAVAVLCVAGLVGLPLACVFAQAFSAGFVGFTAVFGDEYARDAIALTLQIATITVVANTLFGILAAWTIAKYRFPGKALLLSAIDLPLSVSPVVAGLAILLTVGVHSPLGAWLIRHGLRIAFAPPGIALATIFVTFPYVARELAAFLQEQGRELEEAALGLGASLWQTLWHVTLPNARWALLNGILLCNARAMGEFGAVSVISGRIRGSTDTVPLHIEILYNEDAFTAAFALAASLACVTIALTLVRSWIERRTGVRHAGE